MPEILIEALAAFIVFGLPAIGFVVTVLVVGSMLGWILSI